MKVTEKWKHQSTISKKLKTWFQLIEINKEHMAKVYKQFTCKHLKMLE